MLSRRVSFIVGLALAAACGYASKGSATLGTIRVASGLPRPLYVTAPPGDGRLFIVEQLGHIQILQNDQILPADFLDIDSLVVNISGNDERGLLGLAFHPDFPDSPYFFVNFVSNANHTIIARYRVSANPNRADHASKRVLLDIPQPYTNHKGGNLQFGPDRYLYIGMGDGGSGGDPENRAQDLTMLLGKMLRIDPIGGNPYAIPPTNPYFGNASVRQEIWAYGFRNPYRWSFDRQTGDLWVGDVGQNLYEEIDFQPASSTGGEDYGWRLMEGFHCYDPPSDCGSDTLKLPIWEFDHNVGCAVTGGFVYRGQAIPGLAGTYFFSDFCADSVWSFRYDGVDTSEFRNRTAELAPGGGLTLASVVGFGEDGFGELYIVDRGAGSDGEVYKIVGSGTGVPPSSPNGFRLGPAVPNPFTSSIRIDLTIERAGRLTLDVIDPAGRRVARLADGEKSPDTYSFVWNGRTDSGRRAAAGAYFLRVSLDGRIATQRISLAR